MEQTKYDVFISYSRKDTLVANQICNALDKANIKYFIDRQGISGGMEFPVVLANAICNSSIFLFLGSKSSYKSKFTINEITFAFNKKERNQILPYIIDGSSLPMELEFVFAGINWRTIKEHPIDTVLTNDLLKLLGRKELSENYKIILHDALITHSFFISNMGLMPENEDWVSCDDKKKIYMVFNGTNDHSKIGFISSQMLVESISNNSLPNGDISDASLQSTFSTELYQLFSNSENIFNNTAMATMALLKLYDKGAIIAWVGDCRVYRFRFVKNKWKELLNKQQSALEWQLLTKDHNLAQEDVDKGMLSPDAAKRHPESNKLTRFISPHPDNQPLLEIRRCDVQKGDFFILCTKGIFEHIEIEQLLSEIVHSNNITEIEIAKGMNNITNEIAFSEGKGDNRSVCVVRVQR